jgi:hypothetical protein
MAMRLLIVGFMLLYRFRLQPRQNFFSRSTDGMALKELEANAIVRGT